MKVLFSHSYFLQFDPKQVTRHQPYPPLGTILAAALLRENGFSVSLFDTMFARAPEELIATLQSFQPDVFVLYDDGFNYLTKMCLSNMRDAALLMQQYARAFHCKVITTSSDAADHYSTYLAAGADFVIRGEAEYTLLELVRALDSQEDSTPIEDIEGLIYNTATGELKKNKLRPISRRLDDLPLPAWDLVDIGAYKDIWLKHHGYFSINIATTRGCPFKCNWCAKPIYGNAYNMRSPEKVIQETILLKKRYGIDHIWFCDDIFGLKRGWVTRFAELISIAKIKTDFKIQSRADLLLQDAYVTELAAAGCKEVWMGAESGSQRILDAMDKGVQVAEILQARKILKDKHISAAFFIQYGYLSETMEDINQTIALINEAAPDDIGISVSYPLPGTGFYEKVKSAMIAKQNWTDSDDLDMMFHNTYNSAFYKELYKYTHYTYRLQLLNTQKRSSSLTLLKKIKYKLLKTHLKKKLNGYTRQVALNSRGQVHPITELN